MLVITFKVGLKFKQAQLAIIYSSERLNCGFSSRKLYTATHATGKIVNLAVKLANQDLRGLLKGARVERVV